MGTRIALLLLGTAAALAQEHAHGVAGLGTVDFPVSCNAAAQKEIGRATALLHSFGYEEARIGYQSAAKADPSCAMAWWGVSRTWYHPIWAPPSSEELKQGAAGLDRARALDAKTPRERDYIEALAVFYKEGPRAYEQALGRVAERYPADDEAAIFHALQLVAVGYLDPSDKTYAWQKRGAEILNRLLPRHAEHPGVAHYIIHSVDYPALAELGLKAARAYGKIAPDSAHALHMPSHIFTRLGLWDDSIESNLASERSAIAQAQRLHGGGGSFDQLHAMDYLMYAYLQEARDTSARAVLARIAAMTKLDENQFAAAYALAASPARWALERHDWKSAAALDVAPDWFLWDKFRNTEALVYYAKAIGAARSGDVEVAKRCASEIATIRASVAGSKDYDWAGSIGAEWEAATALIAVAEGKKAEGMKLLRAAADHEDAVDKHPVTPGALLPAREMLADLLMENGAAAEALREYEAVLKMAPRRFRSLAGAAQSADRGGDRTKARAYATQLVEMCKGAEGSRPELEWARGLLGR
jgi:tetratricopeptide (TPR) repeat protein